MQFTYEIVTFFSYAGKSYWETVDRYSTNTSMNSLG